jgi:hypothetical protein
MPGMMMKDKKPMSYKAGGAVKKPMSYKAGGAVFKPCAACPNKAKCTAMGKCMLKGKSK